MRLPRRAKENDLSVKGFFKHDVSFYNCLPGSGFSAVPTILTSAALHTKDMV